MANEKKIDTTPTNLPVPVTSAAWIAAAYRKDVVVVYCIDRRCGGSTVTTFGARPNDKQEAALIGDWLTAALADPAVRILFEDFRTAEEAARNKYAADLLLKIAERLYELDPADAAAVEKLKTECDWVVRDIRERGKT